MNRTAVTPLEDTTLAPLVLKTNFLLCQIYRMMIRELKEGAYELIMGNIM